MPNPLKRFIRQADSSLNEYRPKNRQYAGLRSQVLLLGILMTLLQTDDSVFAESASLNAGIGPKPEQTGPHQKTATPSEKTKNPDKKEIGKESHEDAAALYDRGVELFQIAQIQADKGNIKGQEDLLKQAVKNFEQAVKLDPTLIEAQSNIGFAYLTLKKYGKAIREFQRALTIRPNHLNTLNGLAVAYVLNNDIEESLHVFNRLITLDPSNPQYFFNKGSVLQKASRYEEAKTAYLEALKLEPKDQRSLFNMGTLLENQQKYAEAESYYQRAKEVDISNPVGLEAIRRLEQLETTLQEKSPAKE